MKGCVQWNQVYNNIVKYSNPYQHLAHWATGAPACSDYARAKLIDEV